jgi:tetrahydromethanopterin S-methyltransferase subunit G
MLFFMAPTAQLQLLLDIEARHEDLLERLDELDKRVEKTLAECQKYRIRPGEASHDASAN